MSNFNIQTELRPDYHEWFPNFSEAELISRLDRLPFTHATLLTPVNISKAVSLGGNNHAALMSFLSWPYFRQRGELAETLQYAGIPKAVCAAIGSVARESFAPPGTDRYSYLNTYLPWDSGSCVTSPALVGLMLADLQVAGDRVVEIGIGSGYHAACLAELCDRQIRILGIDANAAYARFGQRCLEENNYPEVSISIGDARESDSPWDAIDAIYSTAGGSLPISMKLIQSIRDRGKLQTVRPITDGEYSREPSRSWLRQRWSCYEGYRKSWWLNYGCISTQIRVDSSFSEIFRVYDVTFVPIKRAAPVREPDVRYRWRSDLEMQTRSAVL